MIASRGYQFAKTAGPESTHAGPGAPPAPPRHATGHSHHVPAAPPAYDWHGKRVGLLLNRSSGKSAAHRMAEQIGVRLSALGAAIPDLERHPVDFVEQMQHTADAGADILVAIGGDGTVNAGADIARRLGIPLMIVPAGTMNLVAVDLELPLRFDEYLETFDRFTERRIDTAEVNGRLFLHSSLIGMVPELARVREKMRQAKTARRWLRQAVRYLRVALDTKTFTVRFNSDRGTAVRRCLSVAITCNALLGCGFGSFKRDSLSGGRLGVYASAHQGPLARPRALFSLVRGKLRSDRDVACGVCNALELDPAPRRFGRAARRHTIAVSNDGEVLRLQTPLRFEIRPRTLRVLGPNRDSDRDAPP